MDWKYIQSFKMLSAEEVYSILKLRQDIFIIEQNCIYDDIDNIDLVSEHLMLFKNKKLVAYSRIVPPGVKFTTYSIGRVLVHPSQRRKNMGRKLVLKSIEIVKRKKVNSISIEAQEYLLEFYSSLGFRKTSETYPVDGIPHVEMIINIH